jgi:hypothetical protein
MRMTKWKEPPIVKVYEALTAIGNGSVKLVSEGRAQVGSSIGTHTYDVYFDISRKAIIADDNGSRWQGYLGYPAIAVLMLKGVLPHSERLARALAGVKWAVLNKKFKRDYRKSIEEAEKAAARHGVSPSELKDFAESVISAIRSAGLAKLGGYDKGGKIALPP